MFRNVLGSWGAKLCVSRAASSMINFLSALAAYHLWVVHTPFSFERASGGET